MIIKKIEKSKFSPEAFKVETFGTEFTDHMLIARFKDGKWSEPEIMPYGPLEFTPAFSVAHYGQGVFEGLKAYKGEGEHIYLFRPERNFKRLNKSAERMDMPAIPEDIFMEGIKTLVNLDQQWIPTEYGMAMYIRPVMFATEEVVSARSSNEYLFSVLLTVAPEYYSKPLSLKIADRYSRAANGGVGFAKAAGNYGGSFYPAKLAQEEGYDQIIWTDDSTHTFIEEAGTMNVIMRIEDKLITAPVSERILNGVTRNSILQLAKDNGIEVEERKITVKEVYEAHKNGNLKEVIGVGTAAIVVNYAAVGYGHEKLDIPQLPDNKSYGKILRNKLLDIQTGIAEDLHGWRMEITHPVEA